MANDQTLKERYVQLLIDKVRDDLYPSVNHMDLIEATVGSGEQLAEYLDALMDKVEETTFPSLPMLRRIQRIVAQLPA
jgi:hypothetical protein